MYVLIACNFLALKITKILFVQKQNLVFFFSPYNPSLSVDQWELLIIYFSYCSYWISSYIIFYIDSVSLLFMRWLVEMKMWVKNTLSLWQSIHSRSAFPKVGEKTPLWALQAYRIGGKKPIKLRGCCVEAWEVICNFI